ncbi:hypothetical protein JQU17_01250 [Ponticoccus sp. SC2-23]|uniref:hypothetical protein n=1 Tax=Alexandriicola marinus TaxID=2081710 RepID=UPI000FDA5A22|nr:hypothetical protein [Alexandriicola marinus]MBM1218807.1 hypothetical protein [Ponticoccus sp. SC6-9]MBM1224121.1 hypothetical protein [Ponticoccus sp. SC6-15]MBM1230100.1 hypothetical protein [Ponticoccus sp. SC6-38]MBM1233087.1 hypothetical protein [Ponticoccus sp. SC6-45]MBM1236963.1 hypothetical protein [Ponticoccus sp. SC6-49]MBM1242098.1 hypothetical protein [Ponticoccus sp. SC2-64]MBM1246611.1 hypothetical protein [Ponticoccus sp. SC6-42]MBM1251089.1 hypothetical protein [Pontico
MTNHTAPQIRRRPDGSIDTTYHMAQGRMLRSKAAHDMAAAVTTPAPAKPAPRRTGFSALLARGPRAI